MKKMMDHPLNMSNFFIVIITLNYVLVFIELVTIILNICILNILF